MRVAVVAFILVVFMAAGAGFYIVTKRSGGRAATPPIHHAFIALDGERALDFHTDYDGPFVIEAVRRHGNSLATAWRWSAQGVSSYNFQWTRRGDLLAGELHPSNGEGPLQLVVADFARGVVATVDGLEAGAFAFADDPVLLAVAGDDLRIVDPLHATGRPPWHAPLPPRPNIARHLAATAQHAIVWDGALRVFDRADSSAQRTLGPLTDVVGVVSAREEVIVLRDGALAVLSLADGSERLRVTPPDGPIMDGIDDPCLLGANGGHWIVLYSTTLVQSFQVNGVSWSIPSSKILASIDPATGGVLWRTPIGNWELRCTEDPFRFELPRDRDVVSPLVLRGEADVQGGRGRMRGLLTNIDLASGAVAWRAEYDRENGANEFDAYRGRAFYTRADPTNTLLRFENGRLTGAVDMGGALTETLAASGVTESAAWIGGEHWEVVTGPSLAVDGRAGGEGGTQTVRAAVVQRYGLPPGTH